MTLDDIRQRRTELQEELKRLDQLELDLLCEKAGIKPGDRVRHTKSGYTGEYQVTKVSQFHFDKPWVTGFLVKDDGTVTPRSKDLYGNWEKV